MRDGEYTFSEGTLLFNPLFKIGALSLPGLRLPELC